MPNNVQPNYNNRIRPPGPGTISGSDYDTITGNCETAGGIPFGRVVSEGTKATFGDKAMILGGSLAGFKGISVRDIAVQQRVVNTPDSYAIRENMSAMRRGTMWVEPREAVVADDPVYFMAATGILSNSSSGSLGPIKGARWVSSSEVGDTSFRAEVYIPGLQNQDAV